MTRRRVLRGLELAAYATFIAAVMWRIPTICSSLWLEACAVERGCTRFLRAGWLGNTLDTADDQWRELRDSLPLIWAAIAAHGILSLLVRVTCSAEDVQPGGDAILVDGSTEKNGKTPSPGKAPEPLPIGTLGRRRTLLNVAVSVVFVGVMHGAHGLFPVALVCGAFAVGHALKGTRLAQPVAWVMAVLLIWLKEKWYGVFTFENLLGVGLRGLDGFRGMHPWRLSFNLAILRMVSFNLDLHWAELHLRRGDSGSPVGKQKAKDGNDDGWRAEEEPDVFEYSSRVVAHRPIVDYSLWHCVGYVFYAPLYLAGPTLTFNAYVSHMACPQRSYGWWRMAFYLVRFAFALLLLEYGVHYFPVFALARSGVLNFRPDILALYVYTILLIMWLKFLVIWRLFRFWALCDGVEPPENMQRCMSNNYSVVGFWKGWHCSFNRWLVRYIYVPLGGSMPGRRWNVFVVFLFVAFWHDVEPKLFTWGLLNGVFFVLEALAKEVYRRASVLESCRANPLANRMVQAVGATSNVMALLLVNMIGYAVGIRGTGHVADGIFLDREGLVTFAYGFFFLFSGVQVMFAIEEARQGRKRRATGYRKVAKS